MASLGTFKVSDGGVTLTQGRGAAKTVVLQVSFKELEIWAARNAVDERNLWRRSYGRACKGLRNKLEQVMYKGGGVNGVPKFHDFEEFTRQLREMDGKSGRPMGGVLAEPSRIVAFKRGNAQIIGWPDKMEKAAVNFQDAVGGDLAEKFLNDSWRRRRWHRMGIRDIPRTYAHNPRQVIPEPFGSYVEKYLDEWASGSFYKELARQMAKKRFSG